MYMKKETIDLFFSTKTLQIFLKMDEEDYVANIRHKVGCMYSYTTAKMRAFEKLGLVTSERKGRVVWYKLTDRGRVLREKLKDLVEG